MLLVCRGYVYSRKVLCRQVIRCVIMLVSTRILLVTPERPVGEDTDLYSCLSSATLVSVPRCEPVKALPVTMLKTLLMKQLGTARLVWVVVIDMGKLLQETHSLYKCMRLLSYGRRLVQVDVVPVEWRLLSGSRGAAGSGVEVMRLMNA